MAEEAERTEPATPKRREESRERGEVPMSRDVGAVFGLAFALVLLTGSAGAAIGVAMRDVATLFWSGAAVHPHALPDYHAMLLAVGARVGPALLPMLGMLCLAAIASNLLQTGPLFAPKAFGPNWGRMNPVQGLKRMVSPEKAFDLVKSIVKLGLIGGAAWWASRDDVEATIALASADPATIVPVALGLLRDVVAPLLAVLVAIAVADLAWVRFQHEKKLRMSRQDVRQEALDREGNPHVRSRMRAAARELTRARLVAEVSKADVVIRNPTHFAVALGYDRGAMGAPRVLAKGRNQMALRILEIARGAEVPIVEDPPLARVLFRTGKVGREIPVALYQAIAEVLAHVYRLDRRRGAAWGIAS